MVNVKFHCNYCSDLEIYNRVLSMTSKYSGIWKNINVVNSDNYDVFVIMNYPQHNNYDTKKTIVFESETPTTRNRFPKFYHGRESEFLYIHDTKKHFNVDLWYHGLSYDQITQDNFQKSKSFGIINSNLNNLPGHIFRNNFITNLTNEIDFDLFGRFPTSNKNYKGPLNKKSDGLVEYKYTFNCENDFESNYFTEKILDGIMCECLTFYCGCPNIKSFIDERAFVELSLTDTQSNIEMIKDYISADTWSTRIKWIQNEKQRIIEDYNVLNIVYKLMEKI